MATLTNAEKLRNDLSVIMMCLAKLYTCKWLLASKHSFVSMQHWPLCMKTHVCCIVTGDKFAIQALCSTHYFYILDSDV
jgi:hypothetical protein